MYAVIFRAKVKQLDATYFETATQLRQLAFEKYGCLDFHSLSEGENEIAISYWPSLDAIRLWKENETHRTAQALGYQRWYASYEVEVVEVLRNYRSPQRA